MTTLRFNPIACVIMGAVAITYSTQSNAQQSGTQATVLPMIVVTEQVDTYQENGYRIKRSAASGFRDKALLDTPFSISALSAEIIQDQQAKSLVDVIKNDPSVTLASDPLWYDRVTVRGFYLGVDAVKRDGLSINDQGTIALDNKAAVEVSKGLSGLRYGLTSPGGVINYVIKRPTETPLSRVTLNTNADGGAGISADLSRRMGKQKQFGIRINAATEKLRNHIDAFKGERTFYSAAFDWQATDHLLLELDSERQDGTRSEPGSPSVYWWDTLTEARTAFPRLDANTFVSQKWAKTPNDQTYYSGRAQYRLNDQWKTSLSALRSKLRRDQASINPVGVQPDGEYRSFYYFSPNQERNNTSWQLVLEGNVRTGSLSHELALGVDRVRRDMVWGDGFYDDIGSGNLFQPRPLSQPSLSVGGAYLGVRTDQASTFITDTVTIPGGVEVFGGLRHTMIDVYEGNATSRSTVYNKAVTVPSAGVLYKPASHLSLYASYAKGIEQGGTAPQEANNRNEVMKPLESRQFEVGAKLEVTKNALLTASLFRINKGLEYLNAVTVYVQDGSQVHEGAELTLAGDVDQRLRLVAGAAYLKASVRETVDTALIGKRPSGVPRWQANLYADYNLQAVLPGLSLNGGMYYSGDKAIDAANTWKADDYVRIDAGLRYRHVLSSGNLATLRLGIENLTDKRYLANAGSDLTFGAPLNVKASLTIDF